MALDNASNNDKMLKELPHLLPSTAAVGTDYQIHCFGHIINLCVKAFLALFDTSKKALKADGESQQEDGEDEDEEEEDILDGDEVIDDEGGECNAGDWEEIEELNQTLLEVAELDEDDRVFGHCMMIKVCVCCLKLSVTNITCLAPPAGQEISKL